MENQQHKMEYTQIDLYEFLTESELSQYYNAIKNELKITNAAQFKYASDEDLKHIGLSRPEIRRLRKFYEKYFPHGYLSKIKRLLHAPAAIVKREEGISSNAAAHNASDGGNSSTLAGNCGGTLTNASSPNKVPNNKHIIPADSISVNKQLGTGEFGIVQQGVWTNGTERIQVAIKCLCRERMQSNPMEFLKEAAIMHSIEHENIVRLYGVVLSTESLMLVTELAHLRSLLECLKDSGLRVSFLTVPTLCEFAVQICNGMRYLEQKRLIHRDLAARNILVFSKNKVKISDFGLSRALGVGKDYYKTNFNVNLKLPIAWCAPECINYLRFTNSSDVWAFGVCLWEMFSYGFQPWAALTGLQILEAIDAPNYQRLEQPDCCPSEYYTLMMKCWQDDPTKRPKFSEIFEQLPDMKPEQLKTVANCTESKKDHLLYRQGEIITVLQRNTGTPYWKGVLSTGKTGFFNPSNTVAFVEGLPSSNRDSFSRVNEHRNSSKRKLRTEMISKPQNDFKHTGHVGIDGATFGDIAFLGSSQNYNHVPRQIVTPYKPSEDIEQTPLLLPPTPTSPDSLQTASGYFPDGNIASSPLTSMNPSFIPSNEHTPKHILNEGQLSFDFSTQQNHSSTNPFKSKEEQFAFAIQNNNYGLDGHNENARNSSTSDWRALSCNNTGDTHEYHEISDDEMTADKLDFGPSLLDEINSMFGSISSQSVSQPKSVNMIQVNTKNEFIESSGKSSLKNSKDTNGNKHFSSTTTTPATTTTSSTSSKKKSTAGTVKPISVKDEKILNQAIEIANEISARSMIDLVSDNAPTTQSPKRKFSFRFPHLSSSSSADKPNNSSHTSGVNSNSGHLNAHGSASPYCKKKNFTEELQSIPDIQAIIGAEGREAYNSLIERKGTIGFNIGLSPAASLLRQLKDTDEFDMTNAKTLPRCALQFRNGSAELNRISGGAVCIDNCEADNEIILNVPTQEAPRPMTLPTRGAAQRVRKAAILNENGMSHDMQITEKMVELASSPVGHNFAHKLTEQCAKMSCTLTADGGAANPIPLPPREGKKQVKTNAKRHVRKYPLIIPANGVQRTLSKVTDLDHAASKSAMHTMNAEAMPSALETIDTKASNNHKTVHLFEVVDAMRSTYHNKSKGESTATTFKDIVAYENMSGTSGEMLCNKGHIDGPQIELTMNEEQHTYQNLDKLSNATNTTMSSSDVTGLTDTASLQFESILEADSNKDGVLQSPDVIDGFYNFSIQKETYNKSKEIEFDKNKMTGFYVNEDELRNLDIEKSIKIPAPITEKDSLKVNKTTGSVQAAAITIPLDADASMAKNESTNILSADFRPFTRVDTSPNSSPTSMRKSMLNENNELAGNALFRKVRESVDLAMSKRIKNETTSTSNTTKLLGVKKSTTSGASLLPISTEVGAVKAQTEAEYFAASAARLANSNSVSCEDLLEFADKKPKGCERGVDSDEVRIMMKVLGKDSAPTRCLNALEHINWDVHKAIKLIKLQNILNDLNLDLSASLDALQKYDWDLHMTTMKMKGH